MNRPIYSFLLVVITAITVSCSDVKEINDPDTVKEGNMYTTISTDTAKLAKIIDLSEFKPKQVKFTYILMDNSGKGERMTVPGPSDDYLEALLIFDTLTFRRLYNESRAEYLKYDSTYSAANIDKNNFDFEWLDKQTSDELRKNDSAYYGNFDNYFGTGPIGKICFLNNKILLLKPTN